MQDITSRNKGGVRNSLGNPFSSRHHDDVRLITVDVVCGIAGELDMLKGPRGANSAICTAIVLLVSSPLQAQTGHLDAGAKIELDAVAMPRKLALNQVFSELGVAVEWQDRSLADEVVGGTIHGSRASIARRLLAGLDFVAHYGARDGERVLRRIVVVGRAVTSSGQPHKLDRMEAALKQQSSRPSPEEQAQALENATRPQSLRPASSSDFSKMVQAQAASGSNETLLPTMEPVSKAVEQSFQPKPIPSYDPTLQPRPVDPQVSLMPMSSDTSPPLTPVPAPAR